MTSKFTPTYQPTLPPYLISVKPRTPAAPITGKLKIKVTLEQAKKAQRGNTGIAILFL